MNLVEITADKFDLTIDLIYFTANIQSLQKS